MENAINTQHGDRIEGWPALPYEAWRDTCQTLHMWTQIVGKVRMELSPFLNHWWHVTLYVTPRGLTTSAIPYHGGTFDVTFDFLEHNLFMRTSEGTTKALPLNPALPHQNLPLQPVPTPPTSKDGSHVGVNPSDQTTGKVKMEYTYQRVWQRRTGMNGRVHTREFKLAIARQLASGEKRPAQICREHNLASSVVSRWRNEYEQRGEEAFQLPVSSELPSAEAKLAELERFLYSSIHAPQASSRRQNQCSHCHLKINV